MAKAMAYRLITSSRFRLWIQTIFFLWVMYIGIQFGRFVHHFTTQGASPYISRPPGVDGFLPIGALASFKYWISTGEITPYHPAALVLFVTFIAMSLLAKKSFCSWLCPVGTISEWLWKGGNKLTGRNIRLWNWFDIPLRALKYVLLLFFAKLLLLDMPVQALSGFLRSPYWAMSDVKMLQFFTAPSLQTIIIVSVLILLSIVIQNFWCRYLCPYGALFGLVSTLSPMKIRRNSETCKHCRKCERACPSRLPVARKRIIHSPECTGCLSCVHNCSTNALNMAPSAWIKRSMRWPDWGFPVLLLSVYALGIIAGMVSGNWHSSLTYNDYQQLIPQLQNLGF